MDMSMKKIGLDDMSSSSHVGHVAQDRPAAAEDCRPDKESKEAQHSSAAQHGRRACKGSATLNGDQTMDNHEARHVQVMGIINLTDDSFFADSRVLSPSGEFVPETFLSRVRNMIADGASLIDLGACSTRPGSDAADEETEWKRLEPALLLLREGTHCGGFAIDSTTKATHESRLDTYPFESSKKGDPTDSQINYQNSNSNTSPNSSGTCQDSNSLIHYLSCPKENAAVPFEVSIDTFRPGIVRKAYDVFGPFIVNDISGGSDEMLSLVGQLGLPYIATHSRGDSKTMQSLTDYDDVTSAVKDYFTEFSRRAERFGISDWILDPGFGFAKTVEQNWQLLRELPQLQCFGRKILVGVSRKSMIWKPLGITPAEALPGTQVANFAALEGGADIIRVHDVLEAVHTIKLWRLLKQQR
jgi:dihydropteroate synthase